MARILCVDDDQDILDACKAILETAGHKVDTAHNGKEGYDKAVQSKPDLIMLDVMMASPSDGFHTAYDLRKNEITRYIPILMLTSINHETGLGFDKDKDGVFLPVDQFTEKPITPKTLIELATKLLALPKDKVNVGVWQ